MRALVLAGTALGATALSGGAAAQNLASSGSADFTLTESGTRAGGPRTVDITTSGGNITLGLGTIETENDGVNGAGIAASNTGSGDVTVTAVAVRATGTGATIGIDAGAASGDVRVTVGGVSGNANVDSRAILAAAGGDTTVVNTGIVTSGGSAATLEAQAGDIATVESGTAINTGTGAAIFASGGTGASVTSASASAAASTGDIIRAIAATGDAHVASGAVSGSAGFNAISAIAENGSATVTSDTLVNSNPGANTWGIFANGLNGATVMAGSVETAGRAIRAQSAQGNASVTTTGDIASTSSSAISINAASFDVTTGAGTTLRGGASAVVAAGASDGNGSVVNNGTIIGTGLAETGIGVTAYGNVDVRSKEISVASTAGVTGPFTSGGISAVSSGEGDVTVASEKVTVQGVDRYGISMNTHGAGTIALASGNVSNNAAGYAGIRALGEEGAIDIVSGDVVTTGDGAHGISAQSGSGAITIDSGSVRTGGAGASGIVATTQGGDVAITSDQVATTGAGQVYGIWAVTNGGGITIDSNNVNVASSGSNDARGIHANSGGGDIVIDAGTTVGHSRAIFTTTLFSGPELGFTAGSTKITSQSATATGGNAIIGQGWSVDLTSGRAEGTANPDFTSATIYVSAGDGGAIVKTGDTLGHGFGQYGIQVAATGDLAIDSGTVSTDGDYGNGITAFGSAAVSVKSASISTAGANSHGIHVDGYTDYPDGPVTIDSGAITTRGGQSDGIFVLSFTDSATTTGDITIDSGTIETAGALSHGIVVAGSADPGYQYRPASPMAGTGALHVTSDAISATGGGARGIVFDHAGAITLDSGSVVADAGGIYMWAGSSADITSGSVLTRGGPGIVVYGAAGDLSLDAGRTEVGADGDTGIYLETTTGDIRIKAAETRTDGTLTQSQYTADAIAAYSSDGGDIAIESGTVSAKADDAWGIYGVTRGASSITSGSVVTAGVNGVGIYARGDTGGVTVASGDVTTRGAVAHGIQTTATTGDIAITSTGSVATTGLGATGILARTGSGAISVAAVDVGATGGGANAIDLASDSGDIALAIDGAVGTTGVGGSGRYAGALLATDGDMRVTIGANGSVAGSGSGIVSQRGTLLLDNAGTIIGNGAQAGQSAPPEAGVRIQSAAVIANSGTIIGHDFGVLTAQLAVPNPDGGTSLVWVGQNTQLTNSGIIRGENNDAVALHGGGTVANSGLIEGLAGAAADGVQLQWYPGVDSGKAQIGAITNSVDGTIRGNRYGIILAGGGTIDNAGTITGGTGGVVLVSQNFAGKTGLITNSGTISSLDGTGVLIDLASGGLVNSGRIEAGALGVDVKGGFALDNSGTIVSAGTAVRSADAAEIGNSGAITSNGGVAVRLQNGGTLVNTGSIRASEAAVQANAAVLLDNAGRLEGVQGTAAILSGADDTLVLRTGSLIFGTVDGGAGDDRVTLIGASGQQTGTQVIGRLDNFESLSVDAGYWTTDGYVGSFEDVAIGVGGALQVNEVPGSDGESAIGTLDVHNAGLLLLNFTSDVAIDAESPLAVSGTGAVALIGSGSVTVDTDTLVHAGGTLVTNGALILTGSMSGDVTTTGAGTFVLGDGGTDGSFTGNLANDGTFVFARSDSYDFLGDFSGSGLLRKQGAGTLTFAGDYSFTGTTQILGGAVKFAGLIDPATEIDLTDGTLDISGTSQTVAALSGTSGSSVNVDGGQLTVDQSGTSVFGGAITGSGNLVVKGNGVLNLTGNSTYTGTTSVEGGTLKVNGSIVSPVVVAAGGTLGGNGTVGNTTLNGGRVGPGNSIGHLTVNGDLGFAAGSVYEVEANAAGAADRITVNGATSISSDARVEVLAENGNYRPRTDYVILQSTGGISGNFGSVSSNLAFLTPRLRYGANEVTLSLFRNDIRFATVAATPNQASVANAVEALGVDSRLFEEVLVQSAPGARRAYDALSGEAYATLSSTLANESRLVRDALLTAAPEEDVSGPFAIASLFGSWGDIGSGGGFAHADIEQKGVLTGIGIANEGLSLGVAGGIAKSTQRVDARGSNASVDSWSMASFIGYAWSGLKAQAGAAIEWHDVDSSRSVAVGELSNALHSSHDARTRQFFGALSYDVLADEAMFAPFARVANVRVQHDRFRESGGEAALAIRQHVQDVTFLTLGADARLPLAPALSARMSAGWQHGWGDLSAALTGRFAGGPTGFRVTGAPLAKDAELLDAGIEADVGTVRFSVSYLGNYATRWQEHGARVSARMAF